MTTFLGSLQLKWSCNLIHSVSYKQHHQFCRRTIVFVVEKEREWNYSLSVITVSIPQFFLIVVDNTIGSVVHSYNAASQQHCNDNAHYRRYIIAFHYSFRNPSLHGRSISLSYPSLIQSINQPLTTQPRKDPLISQR